MDNFQYNKGIAASDTLTTTEAILAYSIANYYNWDTMSPAYPNEDTLAKDCKMSARSVRRALSGLVNKGYMTYTRQYNKPNLYTPVLPMRTVSPFNEDTSGLLKDNIKDNKKDSNESFALNKYTLSKVDNKTEEIWSIFENEKRNDAAHAAGGSYKVFGGINKNPRRNNQSGKRIAGLSENIISSTKTDWVD